MQWGWKLDEKILMPIMTDLGPAPDYAEVQFDANVKFHPEILVELMFVHVARMDSSVYQHVETVEEKPAIILNRL